MQTVIPLVLVLVALVGQAAAAAGDCDETKCRSPAIETLAGVQSYDCSGNPPSEPLACADGYEAKSVASIPDKIMPAPYKYYTCCKPGASDADAINECDTGRSPGSCTSPNAAGGYDCFSDGTVEKMTCSGTKIPRETGATFDLAGTKIKQYVCCVSPAATPTSELLLSVAMPLLLALASM
jgi:hypothetical protein